MLLRNISVDCVIFGFDGEKLNVLLWQADPQILMETLQQEEDFDNVRDLYEEHPSLINEDVWGLIGAHAPINVDLDEHAKNITNMSTGFSNVYLEQFHTFGSANRVHGQRVITVGYYALINPKRYNITKTKLSRKVQWFDINSLPSLCFDHKDIIAKALEYLRKSARSHPVGFHLLPRKFTLTELQTMYEAIMGTKLDIRNFRKKILNMELITETGEKQANVPHRAARLYKFDLKNYKRLVKEGLTFRI